MWIKKALPGWVVALIGIFFVFPGLVAGRHISLSSPSEASEVVFFVAKAPNMVSGEASRNAAV